MELACFLSSNHSNDNSSLERDKRQRGGEEERWRKNERRKRKGEKKQ